MLDTKSQNLLDKYSEYNPSPLTIQQFIEFGRNETEQKSFNFLRQEIPVRLSNIMKEINLLPGNLLHMPSVVILQVNDVFRYVYSESSDTDPVVFVLTSSQLLLQDWYSQSFRDLMEFDEGKLKEPNDEALVKFCQTLKTIQARHTTVVQTMAQGVLELKDSHQVHNLSHFVFNGEDFKKKNFKYLHISHRWTDRLKLPFNISWTDFT